MMTRPRAATVGVWLVAVALGARPLLPLEHLHQDADEHLAVVHRHVDAVGHPGSAALDDADHDASARVITLDVIGGHQTIVVLVTMTPAEVVRLAPPNRLARPTWSVSAQLTHGPPQPDLPPRAPPVTLPSSL